jgi:hypothetical protein
LEVAALLLDETEHRDGARGAERRVAALEQVECLAESRPRRSRTGPVRMWRNASSSRVSASSRGSSCSRAQPITRWKWRIALPKCPVCRSRRPRCRYGRHRRGRVGLHRVERALGVRPRLVERPALLREPALLDPLRMPSRIVHRHVRVLSARSRRSEIASAWFTRSCSDASAAP